ncbi:MAG: periplasmic heavy metal sensor [Pseudomonadota bacterium]
MSDAASPKRPQVNKSPRWMKILLIFSLALNFLIIGAVVGAVATGGGKWRKGPRDGPMSAIAQALDESDRQALRRSMVKELVSKKELRKGMRTEVRALVQLMRSPEFSRPALEAQLQLIQAQISLGTSTIQRLVADRLLAMNEAERADYADRLENVLKKRREGQP